jgi:hypothetical protein
MVVLLLLLLAALESASLAAAAAAASAAGFCCGKGRMVLMSARPPAAVNVLSRSDPFSFFARSCLSHNSFSAAYLPPGCHCQGSG